MPVINLTDYSTAEHIFFAIGCFLWVLTYGIVIRNIHKDKFIEIPVVAICANFAWEFLWSFVFITNMGSLYVWGYRLWFFMDCYIFYYLFKLGEKQIDIAYIKKHFTGTLIFCFVCWFAVLYFYIKIYDAPISKMGAYSGYVINVLMSALYILLILRTDNIKAFSMPSAWFKGIGTILISVFCFMHFDDAFLLILCVITGVLDAIYIYTLYNLKKGIISKIQNA